MSDAAAGRSVVVVASEETAAAWAAALCGEGFEAEALPWSRIEGVASEPETAAAAAGGAFDRILLTSASAVRFLPGATPRRVAAACVGERTADAARRAGLEVAEVGSGTAEDLAEALVSGGAARRVLFLRARDARSEAASALRAGGVTVVEVVVYEARPDPGFAERVAVASAPGAFVVGSPAGGEALARAIARAGRTDLAARTVVAVGPRTARSLADIGFCRVEIAGAPGPEGLSAALHRVFRAEPSR